MKLLPIHITQKGLCYINPEHIVYFTKIAGNNNKSHIYLVGYPNPLIAEISADELLNIIS